MLVKGGHGLRRITEFSETQMRDFPSAHHPPLPPHSGPSA